MIPDSGATDRAVPQDKVDLVVADGADSVAADVADALFAGGIG